MPASSVSRVPTSSATQTNFDLARLRKHGVVAGLVGAGLMAAWFFVLDAMRGHALFTPTLLAHVLLSGGAGAHVPEPSLGLTLMFTAVHVVAFAAIGLLAAEFLHRFDLVHNRALSLVLMFGALCVAFATFAVIFPAIGPDRISMRDAFLGNLIAATGMAAYLGVVLSRDAGIR